MIGKQNLQVYLLEIGKLVSKKIILQQTVQVCGEGLSKYLGICQECKSGNGVGHEIKSLLRIFLVV